VVVTSSIAHLKAKIDWDDLTPTKATIKNDRYGAASWRARCSSLNLDRRLRATIARHSNWRSPWRRRHKSCRHMGLIQIVANRRLLLNSADKGAWPALLAATAR